MSPSLYSARMHLQFVFAAFPFIPFTLQLLSLSHAEGVTIWLLFMRYNALDALSSSHLPSYLRNLLEKTLGLAQPQVGQDELENRTKTQTYFNIPFFYPTRSPLLPPRKG